jgi:hypothetical protein
MVRTPKRRNPSGASDKQTTPRRGEKSKQSKVTLERKMADNGARQTKLQFAAIKDTPTSSGSLATTSVTPETSAVAQRLKPPTPPSSPARDPKITLETTTRKKKTTKRKNKKNNEITTNDDNNTPSDKDADVVIDGTRDEIPNVRAPSASNQPSEEFRCIRYKGQIILPPSEQPFEDFVKKFREYFSIIQDILGKKVFIAAWDEEQDLSYKPLETPKSIQPRREDLAIYLGTYINPKAAGDTVYLNLRLVTYHPTPVPLERFGMELQDHLDKEKNQMVFYRQPLSCQAPKSECIGWFLHSTKTINSSAFIPAIRAALKIPNDVAIGVQYRAIANELGKKPPYDRKNRPPSALHFDIDERYAFIYQSKAASLWKKDAKLRLPNGIRLRIIPCFTTITGQSMTERQRSATNLLKERQHRFITTEVVVLPPYALIAQLDSPIDEDNSMTLRRAIMARAPEHYPSDRLIHNVDITWNQTGRHTITTCNDRLAEARRFVEGMIPEFLHRYGDGASKWFTSVGLRLYEEVTWNPDRQITTSIAREEYAEGLLAENIWGGREVENRQAPPDPNRANPEDLETGPQEAIAPDARYPTPRLTSDRLIASSGSAYQRPLDEEDVLAAQAKATAEAAMVIDHTGTEFEFSAEQIKRNRERADRTTPSSRYSMSTAAKTTPGTRIKLKETQEQLMESNKEIEKLRRNLAAHAAMNPPESSEEDSNDHGRNKGRSYDPNDHRKPRAHESEPDRSDSSCDTWKHSYDKNDHRKARARRDKPGYYLDRGHPIKDDGSESSANTLQSSNLEATSEFYAAKQEQPATPTYISATRSSKFSKQKESKSPNSNKISFQPDEFSVSPQDHADHQEPGSKSGSRRANPPSDDPQGIAGDLPEDAGHGL